MRVAPLHLRRERTSVPRKRGRTSDAARGRHCIGEERNAVNCEVLCRLYGACNQFERDC